MELKIYNPQEDGFLQSIDWNFQELKKEITAKADDYKNLVYDINDDDQIKDAKKDRADLRKFNTVLDGKRKEMKKRVMEPYTTFESQIKELTGIVDQAIDNIDVQIKGYEEIKRNEKLEKVRRIYEEEIGDLDRTIPFEKVYQESWLNKTKTLKSIREEITNIRDKVDADLKLINAESSAYAFEMKEEYMKSFDFTAAMAKKQELEEAAKRKAAFEEQRKKKEEEHQRRLEEETRMIHEAGCSKEDLDQQISADRKEDVKAIHVIRRKRVVVSIIANEGQFEYLNKMLNMLKGRAEEVRVLETEEL